MDNEEAETRGLVDSVLARAERVVADQYIDDLRRLLEHAKGHSYSNADWRNIVAVIGTGWEATP